MLLFAAVFAVAFGAAKLASASYITGQIYIDEKGGALFDVESDVNPQISGLSYDNGKLHGTTQALTQKQGEVWTFALELGEYNTILLDIHLPSSLEKIISIDGPTSAFDVEKRTLSVFDSNKELKLRLSYVLRNANGSSRALIAFFALLFVLLAFAGSFAYFKWRERKKRFEQIFPLVNEQEQRIIEALMRAPARQKELRKKLGIPKASFSRYVANLEKKKLIVREGDGKNKVLKLR